MNNSEMFWQLFFWLSTAIALVVIFWVHRSACKALRQVNMAPDETIDTPGLKKEEKE